MRSCPKKLLNPSPHHPSPENCLTDCSPMASFCHSLRDREISKSKKVRAPFPHPMQTRRSHQSPSSPLTKSHPIHTSQTKTQNSPTSPLPHPPSTSLRTGITPALLGIPLVVQTPNVTDPAVRRRCQHSRPRRRDPIGTKSLAALRDPVAWNLLRHQMMSAKLRSMWRK